MRRSHTGKRREQKDKAVPDESVNPTTAKTFEEITGNTWRL